MKERLMNDQNKQDDMGSNGASLEELRCAIDRVDKELLAALNRRAGLSLQVGRLKARSNAPIFRPERESALLEKLVRDNDGPLPSEHLLALYREILSSSRALQRRQRVAYLGPEGTFSHMAAQEFLGQGNEYVPMPTLADIFEAVEKRECDLGAVPIENSLNGTVGQSLDAFVRHEVHIQAEWFSRIALSLLSLEKDLNDITTVYSHPQPLGQCAGWLRGNLSRAAQVSLVSTAAAALRASGEPGSASIGDARLGVRLGLNVLAQNIEDVADNWTRFFIIGNSPLENAACSISKSSLMFGLADKPGSLSQVLDIFAQAGINMSKLESRPMGGERWKYLFFADVDCNIHAPEFTAVHDAIARHCLFVRVLGAYPGGTHLHAVR